ncbi:MAG: response regulator [Myxococcaceae bacterium]|nr:response regulator [Myxococcaceae bacterium]
MEGLAVDLGKIVINGQGVITLADAQAHRLLGYPGDGLVGRALAPFAFAGAVEPHLFQQVCAGIEQSFRWEKRIERPHHSAVWLSFCFSPLATGTAGAPASVLVLLEDVSARHALKASEQRLASESAARRRVAFLADASVALASSLDRATTLERLSQLAVPELADVCAVQMFMPDGQVRRAAYATARAELEAALLMTPREVPSTRFPAVAALIAEGRTQLLASLDGSVLSHAPGEWAPFTGSLPLVSLILAPLRYAMTTFGFIVFARALPSPPHSEGEVTLAEELARRAALAMDNSRLYTEAREASRLKDDFLALISHELRTPLMPILGWAQLLTDPATPPDVMAAGLSTIERNARNQAQLIDDLLDVSRIMTGKLYLEPNLMQLEQTVREAVASLRTSATARRVNLHYHAAQQVPGLIGDPTRLQQVATNLISNAIKFTPAGGNVIVTVEPVGGRVILKVSDTGQGIEGDFLPYVFDRFRQAESATTRKHGGLGLGLSIVRDIVELHGGTVSANSEGAGRGSTFTVQLPEAPADVAGAFPQVTPREVPAVRLDGMKLLLVCDDADSKAILMHQLRGLGAKVSLASTHEEAIEGLRREKPSVVLCDIPAGVDEGAKLLKKIRALPATKGGRTPAIALSAFTRVEDREWSLRVGFDRHVSKPANVVDLSSAIASLAPSTVGKQSKKRR